MPENEIEVIDSTNDTEKTENQEAVVETVETEGGEESVESLKKKVATLEAQKNHWKDKAEKPKPPVVEKQEVKTDTGLSQTDLYALMRNNVPEEDVEQVKRAAKAIGKTVAEAIKDPIVKAILASSEEQRNTARATNTGKSARGTGKLTGDTLLEKARSGGELPESDEDMRKLARARLGIK